MEPSYPRDDLTKSGFSGDQAQDLAPLLSRRETHLATRDDLNAQPVDLEGEMAELGAEGRDEVAGVGTEMPSRGQRWRACSGAWDGPSCLRSPCSPPSAR